MNQYPECQKPLSMILANLLDFYKVCKYTSRPLESAKVTNINNDYENLDTVIITGLNVLQEAIQKIAENKPIVFDETKKQEIYDYIVDNQHKGKEARDKHKENVKSYKDSKEKLKQEKMCPYCKSELVLRKGKFGEFYGCSNYPNCRFTQKIEE